MKKILLTIEMILRPEQTSGVASQIEMWGLNTSTACSHAVFITLLSHAA